jgi:TM2 domain-containing membrane protein YozV
MKKLFLFVLLTGFAASVSFAGNYKLSDNAVESAFAAAEDITFSAEASPLAVSMLNDDEPTKTGYLIRAIFCGSIGLHRSYMGTGGETMWYKYLCIPVYGGIVGLVDWLGVIIKGDEQFNKYKDNPKFRVWGN